MHKLPRLVLITVLGAALVACDEAIELLNEQLQQGEGAASSQTAEEKRSYDWQATVRHVVDGDSLYLRGLETQIRLWGVDAPERDERGYQQAKQALMDLALDQRIGCNRQDTDKYGRIVARCFTASGVEINRRLLDSGVSSEYCRFTDGYYGHCN